MFIPSPQPQFHLIINENHLYDISIKIGQEFLSDKQSFGKVALCLEIDATNDWPKIKEIYNAKKDNSDFLTMLSSKSDYMNLKIQMCNNGRYSDEAIDKDIFQNLIGRNRILAYHNLCQFVENNKITVFGIDTRHNLPTGIQQSSLARSTYMYSKLVKLNEDGYSTITVLGTRHIIELKELHEKSKQLHNCHFGIIKIPGKITIAPNIHQSIISRFNSIISSAETTKGLTDLEQAVDKHKQGLIIVEEDNPKIAKEMFIKKKMEIESNRSLKEKIFDKFHLDYNKDAKSELERGLRITATNNNLAELPCFFENSLGIIIDINAKGPTTGRTALHIAVEKGNKEIIIELLKRGAKYDIPDKGNQTALQRADGKSDITSLFPDVIKSEDSLIPHP